ncbi:uncharacterized protein Z518_00053 [Rhinocladiella mackenziei CBS 650.93]|uniref:Rhinocladiella mackenziei CBS 650.93 unplaced genomic scaffold supercont1.1, whole genome shotgun sequence n=1 Tax=Rhinocladiella mackenziei CBS 650.93 TaxID=1442369 RepID=A0A0D2JI04_9EURO|nr:uncharacterized protein Z518_00053 [Rhinocladiella mackenziei CBS 650.93]KIX08975.1 hypothetical protein Z518_00053 [Rhinocladiella mackenziei CBS 650.93]
MDQALKTRKLSSVSVRRKKFQERQQQHAVEKEKLQEHKSQVVRYGHTAEHAEEPDDASADDMELDVERFDRESSVETPSEGSVLTPDDTLLNGTAFVKSTQPQTSTAMPLKIDIPAEEEVLQLELDEDRVVVPPSPRPVLQASLATLSDFRYDRYSCILDSPVSEALSPDLDTDETFSPIETATPVSFQQPKSRPSLISIVSGPRRSKRRTTSVQSPLSPTVPRTSERPHKRQSTSSTYSCFPAAEATVFEVPDLPANAFELIANASQESLLSTKERKSKADRKSSVPRLSTNLSHTRMSSIKSLIKTPTSATHQRSLSSRASRPSTASLSGMDTLHIMKNPISSNSTTNIPSMQRPPTSTSPSSTTAGLNHANMTALPSLPTPPTDESVSDPLGGNKPNMQRKKSLSTLRRRSESLGQAIKGLGKITTKHDVPIPTAPAVMTPKKQQPPPDLSNFPTPPLPSPRTGKSSAGSISSTRTRSSAVNIGLGLRSVEGLLGR